MNRESKINNLFSRAPVKNIHYSNNIQRTFNVKEVIKADRFSLDMWKTRTDILKRREEVAVPDYLVKFFKFYAEGVESTTVVRSGLWEEKYPPFKFIERPSCIMYSGGSESEFLNCNYVGVDLITLNNFFPHQMIKREFQLCLVGLTFGYGVTLLGCAIETDEKINEYDKYMYEFKEQFLLSWNSTFPKFTIQYPLTLGPPKDDIYEKLLLEEVKFIACESLVDGKPCGKCWKCAEQYFITLCLKTKPKCANVQNIKMDPNFLQYVQKMNRKDLKIKKYPITFIFLMLEEKYGLTCWRTGDPTKFG